MRKEAKRYCLCVVITISLATNICSAQNLYEFLFSTQKHSKSEMIIRVGDTVVVTMDIRNSFADHLGIVIVEYGEKYWQQGIGRDGTIDHKLTGWVEKRDCLPWHEKWYNIKKKVKK